MPEHLVFDTNLFQAKLLESSDGPPSAVTVSLNVPVERFGSHHKYGASVFASGRTGLEAARIALARAGICKAELDLLNASHVSLQRVTIPYIFVFEKQAQADSFMNAFRDQSLLRGINYRTVPGFRIYEYQGFHGKNVNDAKKHEEILLLVTPRPEAKCIRLELQLEASYLMSRGWSTLESWRTAYAEDRYESIFNEVVRGSLLLDAWVPYSVPSAEPRVDMSLLAEGLLRHYLKGDTPVSFDRFACAGSHSKKMKMVRSQRWSILQTTGINIGIPWSELSVTIPKTFITTLKYPGDYLPPEAPTSLGFLKATELQDTLCFCKANWQQFLAELRAAYKTQVSESAQD